jgi:serine/threonine protein kinase
MNTQPGKACIITEYLENGGLDRVLKDPSIDLPFATRVKMALDINRGMAFMHSKGILHRDLKSLNLLVSYYSL